jgi:hypothetical protein
MMNQETEQYPILRSTIMQQCAKCPKKKMNTIVAKHQNGRDIPYQMVLIGGHNFDCMVVEDRYKKPDDELNKYQDTPENYDHAYYVYRCEDPMCILSIMREGMMATWMLNYQKKQESEIERLRFDAMDDHKAKTLPSRKAMKRNRAKLKLTQSRKS